MISRGGSRKLVSDGRIQAASLFVLDGLANVIDFAFHFWMGRNLQPAEFAVLQTLNSIVLVYVTATGVFQPVVGRFVAEQRGASSTDSVPAIFRSFLGAAIWSGLALMLLVLAFANQLAAWLNLPVWVMQVSAILMFLSTLRPVAAGILQGQERFSRFGITRALTSLGRLLLGVVLVAQGGRLVGAVIAFPFGWLIGVIAAFALVGRRILTAGGQPPADLLQRGWRLSAYALMAYVAFMSITSVDLIWVNRTLSPDIAGAYASLVLFRRVIALLPGIAVLVMFPRVAATLSQGRMPDRLLFNTAAIITITSGLLTVIYFLFGNQLVRTVFGTAYMPAAALMGWMGIAITGVSLSSVWLNYFLAHKPRIFVIFLCSALVLEWLMLTQASNSMQDAVRAFGITGWLLAIAGLILYLVKFRPALLAAQ